MSMSFERCVKTLCSQWDVGYVADSMNNNKEIFKTYYIITNGERYPTGEERDAICKYSGCKYKNGYFYEKT